MNHLMRDLAPITDAGWKEVDAEAKERLQTHLAARRLVDVAGPHGWRHSATDLGRTATLAPGTLAGLGEGAVVRQRRVLPLTEVRVPFTVSRTELDDAERGADDLEFDDLDRAAKQIAMIENRAVFHGWAAAGITGITETCPYDTPSLGDDPDAYPGVVARAVDTLRQAGIKGPYGLAITPDGYTRIVESTEHGGHLLFDHLRRVLGGGKVVRAPGLDGALIVSLDGGGFSLELGQDLAVGYSHHDAETVTLYLEESFSFRVVEPDAAITLTT
ncbi:linocin_M18 bacteriocin protein [Amycolatopsis mediterranei S699]|uniref:Type 1 encapsulin shell protein n=3 Tax=Amycolatopsis mediterranei TaxID=33910 RepID=A0A0H3DBE8_AMYMU|nr:family 1 encapsulin nanocompartment shell protein [Amycolatopsis mediterranei]ADJ48305.1 linocin_M18 bacteriocin protein [Amycolatopsis mediterranei U32]AEK45221.1 linocin_M18 bacteriocin protein [Amycolatopsis mediterranei S699]AFO80016.1 linocin_M18 bacteriocin protein [Amycolatopsis mediterranei S699]AGT87144.1 linocin_M18 bacteriocin protein [Amycolatopsis mediterranei RB]KDO10823.1 bacteriocin [Amycolatopsis mediterranei]